MKSSICIFVDMTNAFFYKSAVLNIIFTSKQQSVRRAKKRKVERPVTKLSQLVAGWEYDGAM